MDLLVMTDLKASHAEDRDIAMQSRAQLALAFLGACISLREQIECLYERYATSLRTD